METLYFDCPFCSYGKKVPKSYHGKKIKCPRCLATITLGVPQPTALTALPLPDEDESPLDQRAIEVDKISSMVECPFCFELVGAQEKQCPFCSRFLDQESTIEKMEREPASDYVQTMKKARKTFYFAIASLVCGLGVVMGPATIWSVRHVQNKYNKGLDSTGQQLLNVSMIMGIAGTVGSFLLLLGCLFRLIL